MRRRRAMVGGLPCSPPSPPVVPAACMRSRMSDTGGWWNRSALAIDGWGRRSLGARGWRRFAGRCVLQAYRCRHAGWRRHRFSRLRGGGGGEPNPASTAARFSLVSPGLCLEGGPGAAAGSWLVNGPEVVAGFCASCVRPIWRVLRLSSLLRVFRCWKEDAFIWL